MGDEVKEGLDGTVTRLIAEIDAGNQSAREDLCEVIYEELHAIGHRIRQRDQGCSLATSDVVNDFLGRLLADSRLGRMKNRRYLYSAAAGQMRRLLVDHWRRKRTRIDGRLKADHLDNWLDELADSAATRCGGNLEALEEALVRLEDERPRQFQIVQLKFFGGLTNEQVAQTLDISIDTVKRDWRVARARLGAQLLADQ